MLAENDLSFDDLTDEEFEELQEEFRPQFKTILIDKIKAVFRGAYTKSVETLRDVLLEGCQLFGINFDQVLLEESEPYMKELEEEIENAG